MKKRLPSKPFKKGNTLGKGRPRRSAPEKMVRQMTSAIVLEMISRFGGMTKDQLSAHANDPKIPILELSFCKMWIDVIKNGDHSKFEFLLNRAIGKVSEKLMIRNADAYENMSLLEILEIKRQLSAENEKTLRQIEQLPRYQQSAREIIELTNREQAPLRPTGTDPAGEGSEQGVS